MPCALIKRASHQGAAARKRSFLERKSGDSKLKKFEDVNSSEAVKSKKFYGGFQPSNKNI